MIAEEHSFFLHIHTICLSIDQDEIKTVSVSSVHDWGRKEEGRLSGSFRGDLAAALHTCMWFSARVSVMDRIAT